MPNRKRDLSAARNKARKALSLKPPADLWEALDGEREQLLVSKPIPTGAFSTQDYAQRYGLPSATAKQQLARLVETGALIPMGRCGPLRRKYYAISS